MGSPCVGRDRASTWPLASIAWALLALACSGDKNPCPDQVAKLHGCGRYEAGVCDTASGRCLIACIAEPGCDELDRLQAGTASLRFTQCLGKCSDSFVCRDDETQIESRWRCDGENDCVDASDEEDCDYFGCADGELVQLERECDGYPHCADGSDEIDCEYFVCADDTTTLPLDYRCDDIEDCEDGSDEWDCS